MAQWMKAWSSLMVAWLAVMPVLHAQTVEYIHTDALGSPVAVTNSAGQVIERREYEPYGEQLQPVVLVDGPGFTGHVSDAVTGLDYMQQRYYDSGIGRFLSVDPVTAYEQPGSNFNRYWYANNNPYKFTDPDGRAVTPTADGQNYHVDTVGDLPLYLVLRALNDLTDVARMLVPNIQRSESADASTNDDKLDGLIKSGTKEGESSTTKISRTGGEEARDREYDGIGLKDVKDKGNDVKVGETDSGRRVVARPSTEDGRPTIEVQRPDGKSSVKIRYDDELDDK